MAPSKSSKSRSSPSLKQVALGFSSSKRTASANTKTKKKLLRTNSTPVSLTPEVVSEDIQENSDNETEFDVVDITSSEDEQEMVNRGSAKPKSKARVASVSSASSAQNSKRRLPARSAGVFRSREENTAKVEKSSGKRKLRIVESGLSDLRDEDGRWNKHYGEVRQKMGNLEPIHADGQTKINHTLRVFDLSYEYGPCVGVTRLQRWERAQALGLNPPLEVLEILSTESATEKAEFMHPVFYQEV